MLEIEGTDKAGGSITLPNGRISPDKAIKLVCELMDEMSDEEFVRLATQPVVLKGPGRQPLKEQQKG